MAMFNNPYLPEIKHARCACSAALNSIEKLDQLRAGWRERDLPELSIRIGVNTGLALVGNIGSKNRLNFTCLGDSVNTCSRLEALNKDLSTTILIGEETYQQVRDEFLCFFAGYKALRGKQEVTAVYVLLKKMENATQEERQVKDLLNSVRDSLQIKDFQKAIEMCSTAKTLIPGMTFLEILGEEIKHY
jgi:class 3 adenylate cyclase